MLNFTSQTSIMETEKRKWVAIRVIIRNRGHKVWNYKHYTELRWTGHAEYIIHTHSEP